MLSMWSLPPPPGFQGLRDDLPLTVYEQLLPHWRQEGATYFVTALQPWVRYWRMNGPLLAIYSASNAFGYGYHKAWLDK